MARIWAPVQAALQTHHPLLARAPGARKTPRAKEYVRGERVPGACTAALHPGSL
eukprot:CAMPEP_0174283994 /NCGR_PEP_ID=MMETSP0809-20121228/4699_1 /TAXON_ID=73025 ORGANISM="Eutreptiella gymnastica-like, Strain CCMP1594" /NCGR_SAMPLE_ID=MMETSP0809 /ASSEMBLY_ACC=CAM_ASM_000658 /LENGTH=53 /DNA_ID=CAMNT_0015379237 /DNA_START=1028 /DNA_END=1189 /DNA_ORIENTATION=+